MIRPGQLVACVAVVAVVLGLTACVNGPEDGAAWLEGQDGVVSVEVLDSDGNLSGDTGLLRAELDPNLNDEQLDALVDSVAGYLRSNEKVGIQLGSDGVDFGVDPSGSNESAMELWRAVTPVADVVSGLMVANSVHVRALRTDMSGIVDELLTLEADLRVEGFADAAALDADEALDNETAGAASNPASLDFFRASTCTAPAEQLGVAESLFEDDALSGASLELCTGFTLYYASSATFSTELPTRQQQLVAAGLGGFPVTAYQEANGAISGREAIVTPLVDGDPAAFEMFAPFELPGAPQPYLALYNDRSFEVLGYDVPLADLVAIVTSVPAAGSLPFIRVEGADAAVGGTAVELTGLAAQAVALAGASTQFANVELNTDSGLVALNSPVGTDPDIPAAVADLRASQASVGRVMIITYLQTQVTITDGVASVGDEYTDGDVVEQFAQVWNAG